MMRSLLPILVLILLAVPAAAAQPPEQPGPPVDRLLARELARLDGELDLGTFPDGSGLWTARLAAAIEHRLHRLEPATVPAADTLRRLASQLRGLDVELDLAGPDRPSAGGPDAVQGPERADRARRLRDLLDTARLLRRKLQRLAAGDAAGLRPRSAPVNDACSSAIVISEGTVSGSTSEATTDGSASCGSSNSSPDVWYRYTADGNGPVVFDTFGSAFDTVLALFDRCHQDGRGTELACNDDAEGTAQSRIIRDMATGEEVWIRVSGFGGASGSFELTIADAVGIFGTVTRADTGAPLTGVDVELQVGTYGYLDSTTATDGAGEYFLGVPGSGSYGVRTRGAPSLIDEMYDDVKCLSWNDCWPDRTPILVSGGPVTGIDLALSPAGAITGTVLSAATTAPPDSAFLYLYSLPGDYLTSVQAATDGSYRFDGLPAGKYFVRAQADQHAGELYDDLPCTPSCQVTDGTQVTVTQGATKTGIDFTLDRFGAIAGTVTEEPSGAAVRSERVEVYDQSGSLRGAAYTAPDGSYEIAGLEEGTYYVATDSYAHVNEVYDDQPCDGCDVTSGTPVTVTLNATTGGIDFALTPLGKISGTVTREDTGAAVSSIRIKLLDDDGYFRATDFTSATGVYEFDGLQTGDYYVSTDTSSFYANELYDDQPCHFSCPTLNGTLVSAAPGTTTTGIDFALARLGEIAGRVTDLDTGEGLLTPIDVYDDAGTFLDSVWTHGPGDYTSFGLPAGSYFLKTSLSTHRDEVYDDLPASETAVTDGTPVAVSAGATTSGIDFALDRLAEIAGTVTDTGTGLAVVDVTVRAFDETGASVGDDFTGSDGAYLIQSLPPGSYRVRASRYTHLAELYDDRPCPSPCDVSGGDPVLVAEGAQVSGVDFALQRLGSLTGTVVEAVGGGPVAFYFMRLYDSSGSYLDYDYTDSGGSYAFDSLAAGDYYVSSEPGEFIGEVFDGVLCSGICNALDGTPVPVAPATTTSGVDFTLHRPGRIEGRIQATDTGSYLTGEVWLHDASHAFVASAWSSASTGYLFPRVQPGTYYVRTHTSFLADEYQDELFTDVACEPDCDFSTGTPLQVVLDGTLAGIDFALRPCPHDSYEEIFGVSFFSLHAVRACQRVTAGSGTSVGSGSDVTFTAGRTVVLSDGFSVQSGGSFRVVIEPSWAED